jgi:hypothetical protein
MENSFAKIKATSYFYRIQVGMIFQSYVFPISMVFLSYESKKPLVYRTLPSVQVISSIKSSCGLVIMHI